MSSFTRTVSLVLLGAALAAAGCKSGKGHEAPSASAAEPTASAPTAAPDVAPPPTAPPARPDESPAAGSVKPLREYLSAATSAKVLRVELDPAGGARKTLVKELDAAATSAYLAKVGLEQAATGPLVKCPSDTLVELADASGKALGTIGFCGTAARFDAPDGSFGGITAPAP